MEHYYEKWGRFPQPTAAEKVAEIISWNIWQMDGLTFGLPGYRPKEEITGINLFCEEVEPQEKICKEEKDWGNEEAG